MAMKRALVLPGSGRDAKRVTSAERLKVVYRCGGLYYTSLFVVRWIVGRALGHMDRRLVAVEQRKGLVETWTISSRCFTAAENRRVWDDHDWSRHGEEWTRDAGWKARVIDEFMTPYIPEGETVLEIGPGGGRWTEELQRRADKLFVLDVSERVIGLCRERFAECSNIEYLVGNGRTIDVPDCSIGAIWSYDVFVHINPIDARSYLRELRRVLRPGGRAVIHHPGPPPSGIGRRRGWRSDLTDRMVNNFIEENELSVVTRTRELVNDGDVLTVLERPG